MVNVFVPEEEFSKIASLLDDKRLYKQIVECKQILTALQAKKAGDKIGYVNHPATKMWEGHDKALRAYQLVMLDEWLRRRWQTNLDEISLVEAQLDMVLPEWWGDEHIHLSHRANLYRKDPEHYKSFLIDFDEWGGTTNEKGVLVCGGYKWGLHGKEEEVYGRRSEE